MTHISTETLTLTDAWGKPRTVHVSWIPEDLTGFDAGLENIGVRTMSFDGACPVVLKRGRDGDVLVSTLIERRAGDVESIFESRQVASVEDLVPGTHVISE